MQKINMNLLEDGDIVLFSCWARIDSTGGGFTLFLYDGNDILSYARITAPSPWTQVQLLDTINFINNEPPNLSITCDHFSMRGHAWVDLVIGQKIGNTKINATRMKPYKENSLVIAPNKFHNSINFIFGNDIQPSSMYIYTLNGRLIKKINTFDNTTVNWSTEYFSPGTYILKIISEVEHTIHYKKFFLPEGSWGKPILTHWIMESFAF